VIEEDQLHVIDIADIQDLAAANQDLIHIVKNTVIIKTAEEAQLLQITEQEEEVLLLKEIIEMKKQIQNTIINTIEMKNMINMINTKEDLKMKEKIEMIETDQPQKITIKRIISQITVQILLQIMIIIIPLGIILIRIKKKLESHEIPLMAQIDQIDLQISKSFNTFS